MFHHVTNYQHVFITFAIITGVAYKYKKYNNLPYGTSRTTQCYNKCLKPSISTYTLLQVTLFSVLLQCYPDGDDKSDRYMLVINKIL